MLTVAYRKDYTGEFIVVNTDIRLGIKQQRREWIPNPIMNQHISDRAAIIASDLDRDRFDYARLARHRGGLRGSLKLQTYGTGACWQHMRLDFYYANDRATMTRLSASDYLENTAVYTSTRFCLMFPECFYMVPHQPLLCDTAQIMYLAVFDGHQEIYVLGLSNDASPDRWLRDVCEVISTYNTHEFFFVGTRSNMPAALLDLPNVNTLDYRQFITRCDI